MLHAVALPLHRQRPHLAGRVKRIADIDFFKRCRQRIDKIIMTFFVDDDASQRGTDLTGHDRRGAGNGFCGLGNIIIVENDGGRFPAQFQRDAGDAFAADRGNLATGGSRSGKANLVDTRVADQQFGDCTLGSQHIDDASGQTDFCANLCHEIG